jgi:hypothetical protein
MFLTRSAQATCQTTTSSPSCLARTITAGLLITFVLLAMHIKAARSQDQNAKPAFAQTLVDTVAVKHRPDLIYLGLHLVPQSSPDAIIFAATDRSKIGHKSSCADLHVIEEGTPILEMKGKSSTVLQRLHDKTGKTIGLTVVGLRFGDGEEAAAAKLAKQIGDELDLQISSKEELFEPGR